MVNETLQFDNLEPVQRKPMQVTWERSFFAALRALSHLYFQLEQAGLELHSNCELCDEIRNFLAVPNYRGDNIQSDKDWKPLFVIARDALKHLYTKLEADGMGLHSATLPRLHRNKRISFQSRVSRQVGRAVASRYAQTTELCAARLG